MPQAKNKKTRDDIDYGPLLPWKKEPGLGALIALLAGPFGLVYFDGTIGCGATVLYIIGGLAFRPGPFSYGRSGNSTLVLGLIVHVLCAVLCYYLCESKNRDLRDAIKKERTRSRFAALMQNRAIADAVSHQTVSIAETLFGTMPDGRTANLFTLTNAFGITLKITNYGGRIVSIRTPDRDGVFEEIGIGFDSLAKYLQTDGFQGSLIGRVANRIRGGRFALNGREHQLWTDKDGMHLHGGKLGFGRRLWNATIEDKRLRLDLFSPDGEEGYPGNLNVTVWYSLEGMDLRIEYEATTDQPTIINLTNHAYFNLSAFKEKVLGHTFRIQADSYNPVDEKLLPTGEIAPVKDTLFDFTTPAYLGDKTPAGSDKFIDHNYIFTRKKPIFQEWLAEVSCDTTGRTLSMTTTEPGVQFYAGNTIDVNVPGLSGTTYSEYDAFCLEAQQYPDAINHPQFPSIVLEPGKTYRQTTVYRFGVDWTEKAPQKREFTTPSIFSD